MTDTLWRITRAPFADLSGEGARRFGGRWNPVGIPLVYATTSLALAVLETLVHTDPDLLPDDLVAMRLEVPPLSLETHTDATLPSGWREEIGSAHAQAFGATWAGDRRSALLLLPSVLLPAQAASPEVNVIINPLHPEMDGIRIVEQIPFTFDPRLLHT